MPPRLDLNEKLEVSQVILTIRISPAGTCTYLYRVICSDVDIFSSSYCFHTGFGPGAVFECVIMRSNDDNGT